MTLNNLVCWTIQTYKALPTASGTITKDTVQWKWSALGKFPSPILEQKADKLEVHADMVQHG